MKDIMKIVKSLEDSGLLLKGISKTIQNEAKEQKGGFLFINFGSIIRINPDLIGFILEIIYPIK